MPSSHGPDVRLDSAAAPAAPLARLRFSPAADRDEARVPLAVLDGHAEEAWFGAATPVQAEREGIAYRADGRWLMGRLHVEAAASRDIEQAACAAYCRLLAFNRDSGYPHLLRVWNFLDRLNHGEGDAERYRRFCVGRHRAVAAPGFESRLPAATVIGSQAPGLWIHFLAGREPGIQVENPRQTSAFRYPRDYGPISPSFSRATLLGRNLLVSGTAAVVGHATQHPHDALRQIDEVAANLEALLDHAARQHLPATPGRWRAQALRLYLREPGQLAGVMARLRPALADAPPISVLRGEISRADLMVEIEGVWTFAPDTPGEPPAGRP